MNGNTINQFQKSIISIICFSFPRPPSAHSHHTSLTTPFQTIPITPHTNPQHHAVDKPHNAPPPSLLPAGHAASHQAPVCASPPSSPDPPATSVNPTLRTPTCNPKPPPKAPQHANKSVRQSVPGNCSAIPAHGTLAPRPAGTHHPNDGPAPQRVLRALLCPPRIHLRLYRVGRHGRGNGLRRPRLDGRPLLPTGLAATVGGLDAHAQWARRHTVHPRVPRE